ncbi:hypothetical protein ACKKBG_A22605 [Auxenochlorella protothecoides x Auxenochlorella symbiontica]
MPVGTFSCSAGPTRAPVSLELGAVARCHAHPDQTPAVSRASPISRRCLGLALTVLPALPWKAAAAETPGMSNYLKKRALEPLRYYVPSLLQARDQLSGLGTVMIEDAKEARSRLRTGAFAGLREAVNAVGEYTSRDGKQSTAFLRSLEDLDFSIFQAVKGRDSIGPASLSKVDRAVAALDAVLAAVPGDDLDYGKRIVTQLRAPLPPV